MIVSRLKPKLIACLAMAQMMISASVPSDNAGVTHLLDAGDTDGIGACKVPLTEQLVHPVEDIAPYAVNAVAEGRNVVYTYSDSTKVRHSGGTRAWRNNNPGNLRDSELVRDAGAVGCAGGFAVFPDYDTGRRAIEKLLLSDSYRDLTIGAAIVKYAPPSENDTEKYKRDIVRMTGISGKRNIADLNPDELERVIDTICVLEGWLEGKRVELAQNQLVAKSRQNTI